VTQQIDPQDSPAPSGALPPPGEVRQITLHRRRATIAHDKIDVRPARSAIVPPLIGVAIGALCIAGMVYGIVDNALPTLVLLALLLPALILIPFAGITFIYALFGANVLFDRAKQSGTWQQGFLGMGIGTTELVPFWKIDHITVTEAGTPDSTVGGRTEELSQWEAVLVKKSGKRLTIAGMTVPRRFVRGGIGPVSDLAAAVAALAAAPLLLPDLSAFPENPAGEAARPHTYTRVSHRRTAPRSAHTKPRRRPSDPSKKG
jgi:hypothetical protein